MPAINKYKCDKCDFSMPEGWGGYVYIEKNKGRRIPVPHPGEMDVFFKPSKMSIFGIFKRGKRRKGIDEIAGFNSNCVCFDCLKQFDLDIGDDEQAISSWRYSYEAVVQKDERRCPHCNSQRVKTTFELIGNYCPKCREGIIEEIETGSVC